MSITQRTEAEIRAEIKRLRDDGWEHNENRIAELKAKPEPDTRFNIVDVGTTDIIGRWW